ncbi:mitoferrin-1-like [Daphnia carinata]|uniref:mitoferrin-1-like n=1 Tax=Daphnia carinata TaxID=120202 RepID=UPI002579EA43|nr:mitoferrin-1-like [Daphnia carinata]
MAEFDEYESLPTSNSTTHMIAGSMAGILEHCVMYPIDSVKTRLQSLVSANRSLGSVLVTMIRDEGAMRPLRGIGATVAGAGPAHALYFAAYEKLKVGFTSTGSANHNYWAQGAAASAATVIHDGIMTPAEVVKQRLQMYNSPFRSITECAIKVYRAEGLAAFYRSYGTQLAMNVPFQCVHFIVYEAMQNATNPERTYNPMGHVVSGGVSGALAAAITTPLDVCKTLLNTQEAEVLHRAQKTQISGFFNAAKMVYRLGGLGGFFQGLQARVLFQVPSTAICWSVYEFFKYFLTKNGLTDGRDGDKVTYEKPDTRMSGGSAGAYPINSLNDVSSNSAIVGGVSLGSGHVLMKEDLLPTGSAASSALSAARALGAV